MDLEYQKQQREDLEYRMNATVGTPFIVRRGRSWSNDTISLHNVEHATKTQLVVNGVRFNRERGSAVGSDSWHFCWIEMPTEKRLAELKREEAINMAVSLAAKLEKNVTYIRANRCDNIANIDALIAAEKNFLEELKKITEETQKIS